MHRSFDVSGPTIKRVYRNWGFGLFALPLILLAILIAGVIKQPSISTWMSEVGQAEFASSNQLLQVAPAQAQQGATGARSVKAD